MTTSAHGGYELQPEELAAQVEALAAIGEQTNSLATAASRLAERLPMLGTAPPALHLAQRLHEAAGRSGLSGEITAADTELNGYHQALHAAVTGYLDVEEGNSRAIHAADGDPR